MYGDTLSTRTTASTSTTATKADVSAGTKCVPIHNVNVLLS